MKIKFLGGAEEVGRLAIKISEKGHDIMVDYGVIPEKPPQYPMHPDPVKSIYLTHAHLDHMGALPVYYHEYGAKFFSTIMTANSMRPMLEDSIKVTNIEGYPARFNVDDIASLYSAFQRVNYDEPIADGPFQVTAQSAGHIPGSTMWNFENSRSILVTGDLYTKDTLLLSGAKPQKADVLVMESTYAGKNHEEREQVVSRLRQRVKEVVEDGGKVVLPSFAMGRTQELIMALSDMGLNIAVDGMGNGITGIYLHTPGFLRSERSFSKSVGRVKQIRGRRMREHALENDVIITTSGMLDGGPVLSYIEQLMNDPKSAIFLTGYQVEGTNGRSLMENGTMKIAGATVKPIMKMEFFDLSAHAGHDDLIDFVKQVDPEKVILCHGDNRENLLEDLSEFDVMLPFNGHEFEIE